jgi:response regulator RpfG family c-di-GMP phosphodiesterase
MNMPGMDGVTVLARVRDLAPDTVRLMLTGDADQRTAMQAVNQGQIFRFLVKPCPSEELVQAIAAAQRQYHLATVERDLLQRTLAGSVHVLIEILGMIDPRSFGRSQGMRERIRRMGAQLGIADTWEVEIAAMLANLGSVTVPPMVTARLHAGEELSPAEREMVDRIPETGARLLASIPRLEGVAAIVRYQRKRWDGGGLPADHVAGPAIPLGARALALLIDFDQLLADGLDPATALGVLRGRAGQHDPAALAALAAGLPQGSQEQRALHQVQLAQLRPGMRLRADIETANGQKLVIAGHLITPTLIDRLHNFARVTTLREPFTVETTG